MCMCICICMCTFSILRVIRNTSYQFIYYLLSRVDMNCHLICIHVSHLSPSCHLCTHAYIYCHTPLHLSPKLSFLRALVCFNSLSSTFIFTAQSLNAMPSRIKDIVDPFVEQGEVFSGPLYHFFSHAAALKQGVGFNEDVSPFDTYDIPEDRQKVWDDDAATARFIMFVQTGYFPDYPGRRFSLSMAGKRPLHPIEGAPNEIHDVSLCIDIDSYFFITKRVTLLCNFTYILVPDLRDRITNKLGVTVTVNYRDGSVRLLLSFFCKQSI